MRASRSHFFLELVTFGYALEASSHLKSTLKGPCIQAMSRRDVPMVGGSNTACFKASMR
jgi:hypothetical protein